MQLPLDQGWPTFFTGGPKSRKNFSSGPNFSIETLTDCVNLGHGWPTFLLRGEIFRQKFYKGQKNYQIKQKQPKE